MSRSITDSLPSSYEDLPQGLRAGMRLYIEDGVVTGSFLTALLENNLAKAVCSADSKNFECLRDIVVWVMNEAPAPCHGTWARVENWKRIGGANGARRMGKEDEDEI